MGEILSIFCCILLQIYITFTRKSSTEILLRNCGFYENRRIDTYTLLSGAIDLIHLPPAFIGLFERNSDSRSLASSAELSPVSRKSGTAGTYFSFKANEIASTHVPGNRLVL